MFLRCVQALVAMIITSIVVSKKTSCCASALKFYKPQANTARHVSPCRACSSHAFHAAIHLPALGVTAHHSAAHHSAAHHALHHGHVVLHHLRVLLHKFLAFFGILGLHDLVHLFVHPQHFFLHLTH